MKYLRSRSGTYFSGFTRLTAQFKARSTEKLNGLLQLDPHRRASSVRDLSPELETLQLWKLTRCELRKNWSWKSRLCSGTSTRNTKRSLCQLPSSSQSPEIQLRTLQWTWPGPDLHQQQVSVNPALEITLDLAHAYTTSCHLLNPLVNMTHRGLYGYKRLPFGIASAPTIFQRTMEPILQGIEGVMCYIDDIIVTGATEEEHLERLEQVLKRLLEHGIL